jgi:hypothetical protein
VYAVVRSSLPLDETTIIRTANTAATNPPMIHSSHQENPVVVWFVVIRFSPPHR